MEGGKNYFRHWLPDAGVRAVLVVVHGLGEHGDRYEYVARHLTGLGYAVCASDLPGHGRSDGVRSHIRRFAEFANSLHAHVELVRERYSGMRMFLLGHSMGGLVALDYLLGHQDGWAGAMLSGPAVRPVPGTPIALVRIGQALAVLAPRVRIFGLDPEKVCRDPVVVAAYRSDPMVFHGMVTARLAGELLRSMRRVTGEVGRISLPLLLMQGGADRIVDPEGAVLLYHAFGSEDKTLKIYEGLYHEILNEPERMLVWHDMETWMEERMSCEVGDYEEARQDSEAGFLCW